MKPSFFVFVLFIVSSFGILPSSANFDENVSFGYWHAGCNFRDNGKLCMAYTNDTRPTKSYPSIYKGLTFNMHIVCETGGGLTGGGYGFSRKLTLEGRGTEGTIMQADLGTLFDDDVSQIKAFQLLENERVGIPFNANNQHWFEAILKKHTHSVAIPTRELGVVIIDFDLSESNKAISAIFEGCGIN